jgi:hypothetical protein
MAFQSDIFEATAFVTGGAAGAAADPGITGVMPSYMEAVVGYARAGATRAGDYGGDPGRNLMVLIGGSDVVANNKRNFIAREGGRSTVNVSDTQVSQGEKSGTFATVLGYRPDALQEVIIAIGTLGNRLFGGEIARVEDLPTKNAEGAAFTITLQGYTRRFNKNKVWARYPVGMASDLAVRDLLAKYASGFSARHVTVNAPPLTGEVVFAGDDLSDCIQHIADQNKWQFFIDDWKDVHYEDPKTRYGPPLIATRFNWDSLRVTEDGTQIRTRVTKLCGGGNTTADNVAQLGTSFAYAVDSVTWYRVGQTVAVFDWISNVTAINTSTKTVTLNPPVPYALPQNTPINVLITRDDLTAQALMASKTGTDGVFEHYMPQDERQSEATGIADADAALAKLARPLKSGTYQTWQATRAGDQFMASLPYRKLWGTFTVQDVQLTVYLAPDYVSYEVTFADSVKLRFMDLIKSATRKATKATVKKK